MVDFITSLVGNISLGQLLVYRVFLRVPPELLLAEDVASVHLVNDTSVIKSEKLQKAIADAVNAVAKARCPTAFSLPPDRAARDGNDSPPPARRPSTSSAPIARTTAPPSAPSAPTPDFSASP